MQQFFEVCPVTPLDGVCPEPLVWVETARAGLTLEQFHSVLPQIVAVLLLSWGIRSLVRLIRNR